ncbi:MAG: septum site-determining protein MinC [Clostridiales bacterium]|jgi:septum site-determining protein MinC|nr:septum site-determining protein MinC [Clostridiales bacterium]
MDKDEITFKGKKDEITVILPERPDFSALKTMLSEKLAGAADFFGDTPLKVNFSGRELSESERAELTEIMSAREAASGESGGEKSETAGAGKEGKPDGLRKKEKRAKKASEEQRRLPKVKPPRHSLYEFTSRSDALFCRSSVRGGQQLRHDGSIVVLGDVNPGAEIVAGGSVIILGFLKGMVHAGCRGDGGAFVAALSFLPTQVRIAALITFIPPSKKGSSEKPAIAYIENGEICIAPLMT